MSRLGPPSAPAKGKQWENHRWSSGQWERQEPLVNDLHRTATAHVPQHLERLGEFDFRPVGLHGFPVGVYFPAFDPVANVDGQVALGITVQGAFESRLVGVHLALDGQQPGDHDPALPAHPRAGRHLTAGAHRYGPVARRGDEGLDGKDSRRFALATLRKRATVPDCPQNVGLFLNENPAIPIVVFVVGVNNELEFIAHVGFRIRVFPRLLGAVRGTGQLLGRERRAPVTDRPHGLDRE